MSDQELINKFLEELVQKVTQKFKKEIDFIILFGSSARGEFKKGVSDIDLVIQLNTNGNRGEIEDFANKTFWELDEKYQTQFKKVLSTVEPKNIGDKLLKKIEKATHLYVPIFVFPQGWLDWEQGRIERPLWKPVAILLLHQTLIFEKFKKEGKILYGRDIRGQINPKITFWERWKALQIPFYISLFAVIISPFFLKKSVKYSTKAILYQLDSVLDFLGVYLKERPQKIKKLRRETTIKIDSKVLGFYFKSTFGFLTKKQAKIFDEALAIKKEESTLSRKESYKFVFNAFWFITRSNWTALIKRYFTFKNAIRIIIFLIIFAIISYFVISLIAIYKLTHPNPKPLVHTAYEINSNFETVKFKSREDKLNLEGWLFRNDSSDKVIILVSGSDQNRIDPGFGSILVTKDLLANGFNVLLFDFRGRGKSDYAIYSIGAFEKYDLAGAFDYLTSRDFSPDKIGILSISLGGGTSVLALPLIPELGGLVLDSSYSNIYTLIDRELPGRSGLPKIFSWGINFWARIIYGIEFNQMIPKDTLRDFSDKKVLLIHGNNDKYIPIEDSIELQRSSPNSELWIVPEAGHVKAYRHDPVEYISRITDYFNRVLN